MTYSPMLLMMDEATIPGYYLLVNLMRDRAESVRAVGPFTTVQEAREYHEDQRLKDADGSITSEISKTEVNTTGRSFRMSFKEGPLRWCNPLSPVELQDGRYSLWGHGIVELREVRAVDWFKIAS